MTMCFRQRAKGVHILLGKKIKKIKNGTALSMPDLVKGKTGSPGIFLDNRV